MEYAMNTNQTRPATGKRVMLTAVATVGLAASGLAAFEFASANATASAADSPVAVSAASAPAATSTAIALDYCVWPPDGLDPIGPITFEICIPGEGDGWHDGYGHGRWHHRPW
jgi:hypothetical protein